MQIPVYIYAPEEEGQFQPGRCSRWWLSSALTAFDADLQALGSRLLRFRATESRVALASLARDLDAQGVFFNHLYDPISMVRDNEVKASLSSEGIICRSFTGDVLREPWDILDRDGRPFSCFDSFWMAHCTAPAAVEPPLPAPLALPPVSLSLSRFGNTDLGIMTPQEELSNAQLEYHWQPGSAGAQRLLHEFMDGGRLMRFYADRAKTDRASTSKLSPHIHFGEISARAVYAAAVAKGEEWGPEGAPAVADFLRQLGYREYSRYLSFHFPFTHERSLLEHLRAVPWRMDQALFKSWRTGTTGFPIVDAAMREVWSTGWMHNRMRVVAASFLVKTLLLPWQWGLKHYWDALLDADLECDALGWQYCAGCLADAHPFEHTIDLGLESKKFDPDGNYVRRWLPVLARLPSQYIHSPWEAPPEILADAGVELGVNYPWTVVEMEDSKTALAAVVKIVEEARIVSVNSAAAAAAAAAAMTEKSRKSAAAATHMASGPFRPATLPDPSAAERVWGAGGDAQFISEARGGIVVTSNGATGGSAAARSSAGGGVRNRGPLVMMVNNNREANKKQGVQHNNQNNQVIDGDVDALDEEVESNAGGCCDDDDDDLISEIDDGNNAASGAQHHQLHHQQQQQQQQQQHIYNSDAGGVSARVPPPPPLPPPAIAAPDAPPARLLFAVEPPATFHRSFGNASGSGRRGGSGNGGGGSYHASHTMAVVPTVSNSPSAVHVPDTNTPMRDDDDDELDDGDNNNNNNNNNNGGGGSGGDAQNGMDMVLTYTDGDGDDYVDDGDGRDDYHHQGRAHRNRGYGERSAPSQPPLDRPDGAAAAGGSNGSGNGNGGRREEGSDDEPEWPPESKRQRQGSS